MGKMLFSRWVMSDCFVTAWMVAPRLLCPWDFPGKNTEVGSHSLLQGIFLAQRSDPDLLHWQVDYLPLSPWGSPRNAILKRCKSLVWLCQIPSPSLVDAKILKVKVLVTLLCSTLFNPRASSLPGSSAHGILQARILEYVAILFSRESFQPRDWTWVPCIAGRSTIFKFFTV